MKVEGIIIYLEQAAFKRAGGNGYEQMQEWIAAKKLRNQQRVVDAARNLECVQDYDWTGKWRVKKLMGALQQLDGGKENDNG